MPSLICPNCGEEGTVEPMTSAGRLACVNESCRVSRFSKRLSPEEKVSRVTRMREEILNDIMVPEGEESHLGVAFHDFLDNAQVALDNALEIARDEV